MLGRIACFRTPVKYDTLKALAESEFNAETQRRGEDKEQEDSPPLRLSHVLSLPKDASARDLDFDLRDLVVRGLLHHDTKESRFDLHPIVRRYAYDRLAAPDRAAAHTRLSDYFAAVPKPDKMTHLEDLLPVIELYYHTVRAGQFDEAYRIFFGRLRDPLHFQFGAYQLCIDLLRALFPDGEDPSAGSGQAVLPRLRDESAQAWMLNELANAYSLSGQPRRAMPLFEQHNAIFEKAGNKSNLAVGLGNVAQVQMPIGAPRAAEANLRRSIALCREIKDEFWEAVDHRELGRLMAYSGAYADSEMELARALKMLEKQKEVQGQGITWTYCTLRELLLLRSSISSEFQVSSSALDSARRALELADETARGRIPVERDYVRAHWLLGAAHRVAGQTDKAERHLHEALERCRRINCVEAEADILIDLARLRIVTGQPDEAWRLAEEALVITERSGYALQGADAHLELAKLALARGDKTTAKEHAEKAKELSTCDGPPDYTYKAAYDEACALLAKL